MSEPDRALLEQLTEVLVRRQQEAPDPGRAGLVDELAAAGGDMLLPEIVGAVERSSLGTPEVRAVRRSTPAAVIADVLARAARITFQDDRDADGLAAAAVRRGDAVPVEGPIPDWLREVHRLRESRGLDPEKVLVELEGMGFSLTAERLVDEAHRGAGVPGPGAGALDRHGARRRLDRPRLRGVLRRRARRAAQARRPAGPQRGPQDTSPGWPAPTR